jgi:hypothetical protein
MIPIHMIKLVVGISSLEEYYDYQQQQTLRYNGHDATPCLTRFQPKEAAAIIASGGSIYRVIQGKIACRHRILGFEQVETFKGTMCAIMQEAEIIRTVPLPRKAFQGWRYLKAADAPEDMGIYTGGATDDEASILAELKQAGLI